MDSTITIDGKPHTVGHQLLADTLSAALSAGGISLWCEVISYTTGENPSHVNATVMEDDGTEYGTQRYIDIDVLAKGIECVLNDKPNNQSVSSLGATYYQMFTWIMDGVLDNDATMIDAETADLVVQYGLFGEMKYG